MNWRNVGYLTVFLFIFISMAVFSGERPTEFKSFQSMFFRDWTKRPGTDDSVKPVMASDGYRLPVEVSGLSLGSVSMSVSTQFIATDSLNRAVVVPTGTVNVNVLNSVGGSQFVATDSANRTVIAISSPSLPVNVVNPVQTQSTATDSANRSIVNLGAVDVGSVPVNIVNGLPVPVIPQFLATDSMDRAKVVLDAVTVSSVPVNIVGGAAEVSSQYLATDSSNRAYVSIATSADLNVTVLNPNNWQGQILATDSNNRLVTVPTGTIDVNVTNQITAAGSQFVATDTNNRTEVNIAAISVASVPVNIVGGVAEVSSQYIATDTQNRAVVVPTGTADIRVTNFADMPFATPASQVYYATDTSNRLIVVPTGTMDVTVANQVTPQVLATGGSGGILVEQIDPFDVDVNNLPVSDGKLRTEIRNSVGDGYSLDVNVLNPIAGQLLATDSENRAVVVPTGTLDVNVTNEIKPIEYATNTAQQLMVEVSNSSVPTRIVNWEEMPFASPAAQVTYATDSMNRVLVNLDTATSTPINVIVQGGTMTMDIPTDEVDGALIVKIAGMSTSTPLIASITNLPQTSFLPVDSDGNLLVAVATQSNFIVASISNLPPVQSLKIDTDNNLTVAVATWALPINASDGTPIVSISTLSMYVASVSVGMILDVTVEIGTQTPTLLSDITSGTVACPLQLLNRGSVNLYYSYKTPDPLNSPYLAPGARMSINAGSNQLNYKFLADPISVASLSVQGDL